MKRESSKKVESLYHAANELGPEARRQFLNEQCGTDTELRREVEGLLEQDNKTGDFIRAVGAMNNEVNETKSLLTIGARIGPYVIEQLLGQGGMGQVFRARDSRLGRTVAIKALPPQFSTDVAMKQRFEREAQALAALNHPHICVLHDVLQIDGLDYLVMELVEGESLSVRLKSGALAIPQVLRYGAQIADALAVAHSRGITHRDLKPGNIMVTKSGVKVLDFGLAKFKGDATITQRGAVMGTPQYMAPEQTAGRETDARTDIFALGLILFEMAAGHFYVQGQSTIRVFDEKCAHIMERCLALEPDDRWQNAADVKAELEWAAQTPKQLATTSRSAWRWIIAVALLLGVVAVGWSMFRFRGNTSNGQRAFRLQIVPPEGGQFFQASFAVSPDGTTIAFVATVKEKTGLWIRPLDAAEARLIPDTEGAQQPLGSPDSKSLAFFAAGKLQRIDLAGGAPAIICKMALGTRGGAWSEDGQIIFSVAAQTLFRVPASGGEPVQFTALNAARRERFHMWPQFLSGGHFLYFSVSENSSDTGIYVASLTKPDEAIRILITDSNAVFAKGVRGNTYLLWRRNGTLVAQEFDATSLKLTGELTAIADPVDSGYSYRIEADASGSGVLLYRSSGNHRQLTWVDSSGRPIGTVGEPGLVRNFALSPDGRRIVLARNTSGPDYDLWIVDIDRDVSTRFTFGPGINFDPLWSPDGRQMVFTRPPYLFLKDVTGNGSERQMTHQFAHATDWSGDGRQIIYFSSDTQTNRDLWILPVASTGSSPEDAQPRPYLRTRFNELNARFSPEPSPRWVAYESDESGRYEIYVRSFPDAERKFQISARGGTVPAWSADGHKLFYISPEKKLQSVDIKLEGRSITTSSPHELFLLPSGSNFYEVTADARRPFLVSATLQDSPQLNVIVNWPALLH